MKHPKLRWESLLVLGTVFLTIWLISFIPFNFHAVDVEGALRDFDLTDIYFSKLNDSTRRVRSPEIVIMDIDGLNRGEIAEVLIALSKVNPRVVGIDVLFNGQRDPMQDSLLTASFKTLGDKLLLSGGYESAEDRGPLIWHGTDASFGKYDEGHNKFISIHETNETIRRVKVKVEDRYAFGVAVVKKISEDKVSRLLDRADENLIINYSGNYHEFDHVTGQDLVLGKSSTDLTDKIVLIGLGGVVKEKGLLEDSHFTPCNDELAGRSYPDMYGVVIHANIVSMILREDYIYEVKALWNFLLACLVGYLHVWLYSYFFVKKHLWFHLVAKFSQLITSILMLLMVIILMGMGIKFDPHLSLFVILLSVDILYFYESFAQFFHRKYHWKSWFTQSHDH